MFEFIPEKQSKCYGSEGLHLISYKNHLIPVENPNKIKHIVKKETPKLRKPNTNFPLNNDEVESDNEEEDDEQKPKEKKEKIVYKTKKVMNENELIWMKMDDYV